MVRCEVAVAHQELILKINRIVKFWGGGGRGSHKDSF